MKLWETKRIYVKGEWVCSFCWKPTQCKYIATGHDHTDYSYDVCDCEGAKNSGKNWKDLN